ncbi:hypothetical protein, partial [uncultured Methanobrevibacter sp.]|uniref:hypothetical protein n=1 Tax=uncultured Methanobrevibacter sp. TaxID=253161 RepID=UPI0025E4FACC
DINYNRALTCAYLIGGSAIAGALGGALGGLVGSLSGGATSCRTSYYNPRAPSNAEIVENGIRKVVFV